MALADHGLDVRLRQRHDPDGRPSLLRHGRDNLFFRPVGKLNERGVPAVGLIPQGVWSVLLVFSGPVCTTCSTS